MYAEDVQVVSERYPRLVANHFDPGFNTLFIKNQTRNHQGPVETNVSGFPDVDPARGKDCRKLVGKSMVLMSSYHQVQCICIYILYIYGERERAISISMQYNIFNNLNQSWNCMELLDRLAQT